jgi:hypothetical protein
MARMKAYTNGAGDMGQPNPKRWRGIAGRSFARRSFARRSFAWRSIAWRLLVTILFLLLVLALSRCAGPIQPATGTAPLTPAGEGGQATLRVQVLPRGATVLVDGLRSGTTPITLELPAGRHSLRVELEGYTPLEKTVDLVAGDDVTISGELLSPGTPPPATVTLIPTVVKETPALLADLAIQYVSITLETGGDCNYTSTQLGTRVGVENLGVADAGPFVVEVNGAQQTVETGLAAGQATSLWFEGYAYGSETQVTIDPEALIPDSNRENNSLSQMVPIPTLPATCTPSRAAAPTDTPLPPATDTPVPPATETPVPPPAAAVTMHEGQITILTYPYADFISEARNGLFNVPYGVLDRGAYDASGPVPHDVTYHTLVVENEYLKLTFLPEIGGRLYEVVYKPTGHRETYRNPVLKPSPWGPPEQGWWLAAGGIEWCLPVEEHGYEWGIPWKITATGDGHSIAVSLRDTAAEVQDRVRARIVVKLEEGAAYFTIQPQIENPTTGTLTVKYWTNAMLAPGGQNTPTADLHFVLPDDVTAVTVHSRGDENLPGPGERMPWPQVNGVDMSRLGNWNRWLGFFENPAAGDYMAVYDGSYDEGMVRVFPANVAQGAKGFAFGWQDPIAASNWTDNGSVYVEMHGGAAPTFDDSVTIPAGGSLQWTETWYPVAGLGGLRYANSLAALNLAAGGGQAQIAVAVTRAWSGDLVLLVGKQEQWRQQVSLQPGQPYQGTVPLGDDTPQRGQLALRLEAPDGTVAAQYSANFNLK